MSELNNYINTQNQFTAPKDGIPVADHTEQMNYGLGMTNRAAEASRQAPAPAPPVMPPITPVAN
jgi:hypothetical protein